MGARQRLSLGRTHVSCCGAQRTPGPTPVARANGCPWDKRACDAAAIKGRLGILAWLHANGCPWDEWTCACAAAGGHLDVIKWLRDKGCPWDPRTCACAARCGHVGILRWARANGCPCDDKKVLAEATKHGHLAILNSMITSGSTLPDAVCTKGARFDHLHIVKWARTNGRPVGRIDAICRGQGRKSESLAVGHREWMSVES
ncbi:ankyrin repeat protein [Pandoravirus inopinatum]|uniref:Ankyrin repeat protein n=1 Tax=Pandoravirus inopinatum TaxID=1605721 RepID=A0A0B5J6S4_9VIRU|nr:ankyrin repeat protein [Pandoravirus inopinatum]AJF97485.1 ankyrin repeat protein [Pandoravirus inopinatum]